ncbi:hypothetical protein AB833_18255 [Chromatiales bacterium (ex Bugula neritina AB1)]|nr:hypothetical protein AB833_18255 [Chromatiales bacterium (ex Bugula neritina AB1)]
MAIFVCIAALSGSDARAHEIRPAVATVTVEHHRQISISLLVNLESLIAEVGPQHSDTGESANGDRYMQLRSLPPTLLEAEFEDFRTGFISAISVVGVGNSRYVLQVEALKIPAVGDIAIARDTIIELTFIPQPQEASVTWQWAERFGEIIVRTEAGSTGTEGYAALLSPGQRSGSIALFGEVNRSITQEAGNYLVVGFEHILPKGWDHVLFVIALVLLSPRWKPLLLQVTTFTIAHSITLILGATGWLNVSASVVEPLIALSIVVVCMENIFPARIGRLRVPLVFLFGLLHGLGFAGVLIEVGLESNHYIVALLAFNIGIELGQLAVILACLLLFGLWLRDKPWYYRRITQPASVLIGATGVWWFFQRVDGDVISGWLS